MLKYQSDKLSCNFEMEFCRSFCHLLFNDILINTAYRIGLTRVGCKVCPMSGGWHECIMANSYGDEIKSLYKFVEEYAESAKKMKHESFLNVVVGKQDLVEED